MPKTIGSWVAQAVFIALLSCVFSGSAFADLTVQGTTSGQFYLGPIEMGTSLTGLTFNGADFGPTTVSTSSPTALTLGTFSLSTLVSYFDPFDFKLSVSFTAPSYAHTSFKADLSGLVSIFGGSATINFVDNGPRHFTFSNSEGSGSFDLSINDLKVANGKTASIFGTISNATFATTPEPASIVLTTALLGGLIVLFRKRLKGC
jgi:hypothetical protein